MPAARMYRDQRGSPGQTHLVHAHHDGACDCGHDHAHPVERRSSAAWGALAPVLACSVCPACIATYAKVLATVGVGAALSEREHTVLLAAAVAISIGSSAHRTWRSGRAWPLLVALAGCGWLVLGHLLSRAGLEWLGMGTLLIGGVLEHQAARRRARGARPLAVEALRGARSCASDGEGTIGLAGSRAVLERPSWR